MKYIDRIAQPWEWVESWQGYSLTAADYHPYIGGKALIYNPSFITLSDGDYELIITEDGENQIHFYISETQVKSLLASDTIQIDFHIDYEFTEFDFNIDEPSNTYSSTLQWQFPDNDYTFWTQFEYHPDLTSATTFNASFFHMSEYASVNDFKSLVVEEFQFYPNEYNFTTFEFTGFEDYGYEMSVNLTYGGDFDDIIQAEQWWRIKPFSITVQTSSGERYLDEKYIRNWQHESGNYPVYLFYLARNDFEELGILNDTEVLLTYYYYKESLSYYSKYDDILYGGNYTFIIRDSDKNVIWTIGNVSSIVGNNITFTEAMKSQLGIGEKFTIEMEVKTKGGLLDTKHFFVEVQPWEMKFYNNYYPFSGGSIIAPLYYNLSANYQYQLALNYRLQEKSLLSFEIKLDENDITSDSVSHDLNANTPMQDFDNTPVIVAYFINSTQQKEKIEDEFISYNSGTVTISNIIVFSEGELAKDDSIFISILPETDNKYQNFHNLRVDLISNKISLTNWDMAQDPDNNLVANFESSYFVYDTDPKQAISKGKVKQVYAILNSSNSLIYYLEEDLNDATNGWKEFDTLIMKMGFLNPDVLDYLDISFHCDGVGEIGSTKVTLDMFEDDTGAVYIKLPSPESSEWAQFTVAKHAYIKFDAVFYQHDDYKGFFYEQGLPTYQTVIWDSEQVVDNTLELYLDREVFSLSQSVLVFNDQFEIVYETTVDVRTEEEVYNGETYTLEFNNISLPETYTVDGKTFVMKDEDVLYLKYNAKLVESFGLTVEEMILQKEPYIEDPKTNQYDVPIAEISLLGIHNDGNFYTTEDLYESRNKLVAWDIPLDITPFESEFYNTYKQHIINITFDDIDSNFKVVDSDNIEHCYITDILITSNDPRYEIVIDSIFLFEFDENATLYDSDIFDVYPNNHMTTFYFGNYADIYSESRTLDTTGNLPLYYNNYSINETYYFDAFDSEGNWYYFGEHLIAVNTSTGIYEITWNPLYSEEYYYAYLDADEDLQDLFDYYHPHIDQYQYLYVSWADEDAWQEWQTIDQVNINVSTVDVTFEWYDEGLEEYQSVVYNQTLGEFEARNIAVEMIYPYNSDLQTDTFELSQDYSDALGLDILEVTAYFFNESAKDFDQSSVVIQPDKKSCNITAPSGFKLNDFEKIIIYLNFTEGAYSDFAQFRLREDANLNHPEAPAWTKNDSIYVDFEYTDIDYFLLIEDYAVGSEDSLFSYFDYMRNDIYIDYSYQNEEYSFDKHEQAADFANFSKINDPRTVIEFYDSDLNGEHELIIQKEDVTVDGIYDVFSYGELNPAGEITFHTILTKVVSSDIRTEKRGDIKVSDKYKLKKDPLRTQYKTTVQRTIITNTTITHRTDKTTLIIQKDLDFDGLMDKEITFEAINSFTISETYITEITEFTWKEKVIISPDVLHGALTEHRNSTYAVADASYSFVFKDLENGEISSTRIYQDAFPNELSEVYNLENYKQTIINDGGDDDPSNDLIIEAPQLESLLSLTHTTDNVPAIFDNKISIDSENFTTENILATTKTVQIKDPKTGDNVVSSTLDIIEVIPEDGIFYDNNPRYNPENIEGSYWYYSSADNGVYDTIFVVDEDGKVMGIGFDYDYNSILEPNKRLLVEKHIIDGGALGYQRRDPETDQMKFAAELYIGNSRINFEDYDSYDGIALDFAFTDSLFDIWKIQYTSDTSRLMEEVMSITSHQFIQSVRGRIVGDIAWQVTAQLIGVAVGAIFSAAAGWAGPIGYLIGYGIANAIYSYVQAKNNEQLIASQTTHNINYESDITLSDKKAYDKLWGGTLPNIVGFSTAGVYTPVQLDYDNHSYKGEVLLAPKGQKKAEFMGLENVPIKLDYALQTRSYLMYSDFDDPRLFSHFFNWLPDTFEFTPMDSDYKYMANTIMYLEYAMAQETNGQYDTIFPYMIYGEGTFVPTLQFAGVESTHPLPEFFREYPILVDSEYYSELEDNYYTIYKVFDGWSSHDIELIPEQGTHTIYGDITQINVHYYDTLGYYQFSTYYEDSYTFDNATGIITLDSNMYGNLIDNIYDLMTEHSNVQDYDAYCVLEVKVEKYRSLTDLHGFSQEQVDHIATMQAVEQSILEYTYQYTHAVEMQKGLSEMFYTFFVTTISTVITLPITLGVGYAASKLSSPAVKSAALGSKAAAKTVLSTPAKRIAAYLIRLGHVQSIVALLASPFTESLQEIFLDPYLETIVTNLVGSVGGNVFWQVLASSLVEGGRETITGPLSQFLFTKNAPNTMVDQQISSQTEVTAQDKILEAEQVREEITSAPNKISWAPNLKTAAVAVFSALSMIGGPMFFAATLAGMYSTISSTFREADNKPMLKTILEDAVIKAQFRLTGVPVEVAIKDIDINPDMLVRDIKRRVLEEYGLSYLPQGIELIQRGRLFSNEESLANQGFRVRDIMTIVVRQSARAPSTTRFDIINKYKGSRKISIPKIMDKYIDPDAPTEYLIPIENLATSEDFDQDFLKRIWKLGVYEGRYVFGMVYRWTNTKSEEFGYDIVMRKVGRTEQRRGTHIYRPVSGISIRFQTYLDDALRPRHLRDIKEGTIEYDMRVIYEQTGGVTKG